MKILGLNASPFLSVGHDASAAIIIDGEIKFAIEEERLVRKKRAYDSLPMLSTKACLDHCNINLEDIDYIVFGWDFRGIAKDMIDSKIKRNEIARRFFPKKYFNYTKLPKIIHIEHHRSHASSTYRSSGFKESAILIIDGQGEYCSTSIWHAKGNIIKKMWSNKIEESLGYMYSSMAKYIGMRNGDEGKLMGLAPYGEANEKIISALQDIHPKIPSKDIASNSGHLKKVVKQWLDELEKKVGEKDISKTSFNKMSNYYSKNIVFTKFQKDLAFSTQKVLEREILKLVDKALELTGSRNLCLAGGVSLNCIANQKILEKKSLDKLYVFPAANDAGSAIGAALEQYSRINKEYDFKKNEHSYFGPSFSNTEIEKELKKFNLKYKKVHNIESICGKLIAKNNVIGWFQGRMEFGPRALGNRSILANPSNKNMWDKVNKIKDRELWRPFAPSILAEHKDNFFQIKNNNFDFMIVGSKVNKGKEKLIPAVTHKDGTSRPHAVRKEINKKYYNLINSFYKETKLPVLLNTSFNGKGEPIVCTPRDAMKTFFTSGLDYLAIGDFLVSKK